MVRIGIRCLVVALILSAYVRSEWNFGEIDNLVIAYNDKDLNDSITYQKVKESLYDNPRKFNDTLCVLQFRRIFEGVSKKEKWAEKGEFWRNLGKNFTPPLCAPLTST